MRSKRLLALLLAMVLVFTMSGPAFAVSAGENAAKPQKTETTSKGSASPLSNDKLVDSDGKGLRPALNNQEEDKLNVKLEEDSAVQNNVRPDNWSATEVDKDLELTVSELPECLQELEEAAEVFARDEKVAAFVVMEEAPLCESYSAIDAVPQRIREKLLNVQDKVINWIEKNLTDGMDLDVRYQFTYLTNSFTIETEFGHLAEIAKREDVKSVFVMPVFQPATVEDTMNPQTASSGEMTGVAQVWQDLGYTGAGMKIAIIDTGLDLDHPSFAADPELTDSSMTRDDITAVLEDLNAYELRSTITANTLYRSAKVPFAFNYVDASLTADHSADSQGDHGTHVAGIAAANEVEGTSVVGMAPDAQLVIMKVFGASGGAYMDDICAALEDAMTLGCDVVNASLGSPAGFSSTDSELDSIFERLAECDIVANFSAGNEGTSSYDNMWGTDLNRTQNPDNGTVGSPSTYANTMSIASADNSKIMTNYFAVGENKYLYSDPYMYTTDMLDLAGQELEYVIVPGLGEESDFYDENYNSLVEGKVAVIERGTLNFGDKVNNAANAGAVAVVIRNNEANANSDIFSFGMSLEDADGNLPWIPACLVSYADGLQLMEEQTKIMTVSAEAAARDNTAGGQLSSFSGWGVSPDLRLLPDLTGIGGNVYSCYDGGKYGLMSGTSMSSPQVAGVSALVMQYLYEKYGSDLPDGTLRELAIALLMSTADPVISQDSEVEASPRQQGAGLVDAYEAVTTEAYLTVNGDRPKAELGDDANGTYTFSFEIHNISNESRTYSLDSSLLTEAVVGGYGEYFMAGYDLALSGTVTFDKDTVTVPANGQASVSVTVTLSDEDKAYFEKYWENGGYVEGYVYLNTETEDGAVSTALNLPFLGFYGDWTQAPVFDTAYWYDNSFWMDGVSVPEGDQYYHVVWTDLGGTEWVLGINPYTGAMLDEDGNVFYDPAHNVLSPNGDGVLDGISDMYLSLLRNAAELTLTYTVGGEVVHEETITDNTKTMYLSNYGQIVPWLYSWYGEGMYDFTDANGKYLDNGTEVLLTVTAKVDYAEGGEHTLEIPFTVDTEKPELVEVAEVAGENAGEYYLGVEVSDNLDVAYVVLMNPAGTQTYGAVSDVELEDGVAWFDITDRGTEFLVAVCDYAANESYYTVSYGTEIEDGNLPALPNGLYAYRMDDDQIDSEHMYGWIGLAADGSFGVYTDDYMEYAAINAADYVGGKLFGFDSVGNFVVMDPGLWNRTTIAATGLNVLDMTFDDSNDTMYVLATDDYGCCILYSVDLLTGEMEPVMDYGYYGPYTLADDDEGILYAVMQGDNTLYTMSAATDFAMTPVQTTDTDGNAVDFTVLDADGNPLSPYYMQSMTWDNGVLYWAYYSYSWYYGNTAQLIAIDLETLEVSYANYAGWAYDSEGELVQYYPNLELVALHTLTSTDYQIPAAEALTGLRLSDSEMTLIQGDAYTVSAAAVPWNYDLKEVTWSSSNEKVATVAADGTVTAVGEGVAVITASSEGVSAECTVTVVDVATTFRAYDYLNGNREMVQVDTSVMKAEAIAVSPVDFLAGDYNGHDGYFYGYSEGGQFWRYNMETGEAVQLGDAIGSAPADMAYDYTTGLMYAVTLDYNSGASTLAVVSLDTGKLQTVNAGEFADALNLMLTLACDDEGNLYTMDMYGSLYQWQVEDNAIVDAVPLMEGLGELQYMQSMCWDHENDVILWAYCEAGTIAWLDPDNGYAIALGDPTGAGVFEFVGMHTVPAEIEPLPEVAVESLEVADMLLLVGASKTPAGEVKPYNATNRTITWTSSNEAVVKVNGDGAVTGVSKGEATLTATLDDFTASCTVTVIEGADNLYGHVLSDLATGGGQYWVRIYPADPTDPDYLTNFSYILYAGEEVDGKLYTLGYDPNDWEGNWQFFVLDAATYAVLEQQDMGEVYPFVYDMTYDPATATMYAVAGYDNTGTDTDLYAMDMTTGALTMVLSTEPLFMSLAAGEDGVLYAIENSRQVVAGMDDWGWEIYDTLDAVLYTVDPVAGTVTEVGSTGMKSNMMSSMAYDFDTGMLYWTPLFEEAGYVSCLAVVNPETGKATSLGTVGSAGAQISGLYIVGDEEPEPDLETLHKLFVSPEKELMSVGDTLQITASTIPAALTDCRIAWTSSNKAVATVSETGEVTALALGSALITATATANGVSMSATCEVTVMEAGAAFLTWNVTENHWTEISRSDYTVVTPVSEPDEAAVDVAAIDTVDGVVYGFDVNGQLFKLDENYNRTNIGNGLVLDVEEGYSVTVEDIAYDSANQRMLALGTTKMYDTDWGEYWEIEGGVNLYEVDLTTGELTQLCNLTSESGVKGLTCDGNGNAYYYSTFDDTIKKLDLTTGDAVSLASLQTQSLYGDSYYAQSLYYDELSGKLYLAQTQNGSFYRMIVVDVATGKAENAGNIGNVFYDEDNWEYYGEAYQYAGLTYVVAESEAKHEMVYHKAVEATCASVGNVEYWTCDCEDCLGLYFGDAAGTTVLETVIVPVDPDNHVGGTETVGAKAPTASEEGYTGDQVCVGCGAVLAEGTSIPKLGGGEVSDAVETGKGAPAVEAEIPVYDLLTEEEKALVAAGATAEVTLTVDNIDKSVSAADKAAIAEAIESLGDDAKVGMYLDVELLKQVGDNAPVAIDETGKLIRITVDLPADLVNSAKDVTRTFYVARIHDGKVDILKDLDQVESTVTFETDRFSTYGLVYVDEAVQTPGDNAQTGDYSNLALWTMLLLISAVGLSAMWVLYFRKKTV